MKKIAKISLVAAIAVAGFTNANAQPLEEAIKNVDVSGSVVYRYNDSNNNTVNSNAAGAQRIDQVAGGQGLTTATNNNYKVAVNAASKVNDDVKFNSRILVGSVNGDFAGNQFGATGLDTQNGGDSNPELTLSNAYFGYTGIKNTTVNVGKQGLTTPWTVAVDSDGNEQTGTGILALSTLGNVTLAGAYFNQTNLGASNDDRVLNNVLTTAPGAANLNAAGKVNSGSEDIATIGVIANLGMVTADAWYAQMDQAFDTYTVGAKSSLDAKGAKFGVDARYVSLTLDEDFAKTAGLVNAQRGLIDTNTIAKIALTAKAGILDGKLAYAKTGKEGGLTALDRDAATTLLGWNLNAHNKVDADYWQAVAGVDVLSNLNLSANYGVIDYQSASSNMVARPNSIQEEEMYAQLLYKMSKNLSGYVRYGLYSKNTVSGTTSFPSNNLTNPDLQDDTRGRLQVEYTF